MFPRLWGRTADARRELCDSVLAATLIVIKQGME